MLGRILGRTRRRPARRGPPGSRRPPAASCSGCRSRRAPRRRGAASAGARPSSAPGGCRCRSSARRTAASARARRRSPPAAGTARSPTRSARRTQTTRCAIRRRRAPARGPSIQYQLGLRRGASGRLRRRVASPPRWLGGSRQVTGTRLYELVPPLPVLEVSNAGPPPFRGYPQSSGWVRTDATPFARPRRSPAPSSPRGGR